MVYSVSPEKEMVRHSPCLIAAFADYIDDCIQQGQLLPFRAVQLLQPVIDRIGMDKSNPAAERLSAFLCVWIIHDYIDWHNFTNNGHPS